jgi:hypothetical protein
VTPRSRFAAAGYIVDVDVDGDGDGDGDGDEAVDGTTGTSS